MSYICTTFNLTYVKDKEEIRWMLDVAHVLNDTRDTDKTE